MANIGKTITNVAKKTIFAPTKYIAKTSASIVKNVASEFVPSPTKITKGLKEDLTRFGTSKTPSLKSSSFKNSNVNKDVKRIMNRNATDIRELKFQVNSLGQYLINIDDRVTAIQEDTKTLAKMQTIIMRDANRNFSLIQKQLEKIDRENLELRQVAMFEKYNKQRTDILSKIGNQKTKSTTSAEGKQDSSFGMFDWMKIAGGVAGAAALGYLGKKTYDRVSELNETTRAAASAAVRVTRRLTPDIIRKSIAKIIAPSLAKLGAKKIPVIGAILGAASATYRLYEGDKVGAGMEALSGGLSFFPGASLTAGLGLDIAIIARDVYKDIFGTYPDGSPDSNNNFKLIVDEVKIFLTGEYEREQKKQKKEFTKEPSELTTDKAVLKILEYWKSNPELAGKKGPEKTNPLDLGKATRLYYDNTKNVAKPRESSPTTKSMPSTYSITEDTGWKTNNGISNREVVTVTVTDKLDIEKLKTLEKIIKNLTSKQNGKTEIKDKELILSSDSPHTIILDSETILFKKQGVKLTKNGFESIAGGKTPEWAKKVFDESYTEPKKTFGRRNYRTSGRSFVDDYNDQKTIDSKQDFLAYGKLPKGFEFLPGHMGTLGSPGAVMARGAMPYSGGGYSGGGGGGGYSGGGGGGGGSSGGDGGGGSSGGGGGTASTGQSTQENDYTKWAGKVGKSQLDKISPVPEQPQFQSQIPRHMQHRASKGFEVPSGKMIDRSYWDKYLNDPNSMAYLAARAQIEVGGQPNAQLKWIESALNRGESRKLNAFQVSSGAYYPGSDKSKFEALYSQYKRNGVPSKWKDMIMTAWKGGSNTVRGGTGNESAGVQSGGAPITATGSGERFVLEHGDRKWRPKLKDLPKEEGGLEALPKLSTMPREFLSSQNKTSMSNNTSTSGEVSRVGRSFTKEQLQQANAKRSANIQANITFAGAEHLGSFPAGTGGRSGPSLPYGQWQAGAPVAPGPKLNPTFARMRGPGNTQVINVKNMYDENVQRMREQVQVHPAIGGVTVNGIKKLVSAGCIAVDPSQYDSFMKSYSQYYKDNNGKVWIQFLPSPKGEPHKIVFTNIPPDPSGIISESQAIKNFTTKGDVQPETAEKRAESLPPEEKREYKKKEKELFLHGMQGRYGNKSIEEVESEARKVAALRGKELEILPGSGGARTSQINDAVKRLNQGGISSLQGFSAGGYAINHILKHPDLKPEIREQLKEALIIGAPNAKDPGISTTRVPDPKSGHMNAIKSYAEQLEKTKKMQRATDSSLTVSSDALRIKTSSGKTETGVFGQGQAFAGGATHSGTTLAAQRFQKMFGDDLTRFTAFNDMYHKGTRSFHAKGLAGDFTIKDGNKRGPEVVKKITEELKSHGLVPGKDFKIIDEYNSPSARSTGGHIHYEFRSPQAAQKFQEALERKQAEMRSAPSQPSGAKPQESMDLGITPSEAKGIGIGMSRSMKEAITGIQQPYIATPTEDAKKMSLVPETTEEMMAKYNREQYAQSLFPTENEMAKDPTAISQMHTNELRYQEQEKRKQEEVEQYRKTAKEFFATEDAVMVDAEARRLNPMPTENENIVQQQRDDAARALPSQTEQAGTDEAIAELQQGQQATAKEQSPSTKPGGGDSGERSGAAAPSNLGGGNHPESSASSPGSGGYGSYGRCFV